MDVDDICRNLGRKLEGIYSGHISLEDTLDDIGIYRKSLFVRVSVGLATNFHDCFRFI